MCVPNVPLTDANLPAPLKLSAPTSILQQADERATLVCHANKVGKFSQKFCRMSSDSELCVRSMRAVSGRRHMGGQCLSQTTIGRRCPPCLTTHHLVSALLSQPFISILCHLNRSSLFSLTIPLFSQHFQDSNFFSSVLLYLNLNSRPGKWTSSVFWFLIDGLRDRDPRHWDSGQRWLDLQSVCHGCRQAPSLGRHCPTLCW